LINWGWVPKDRQQARVKDMKAFAKAHDDIQGYSVPRKELIALLNK